jgi:ABC-type spermidine/putrescine transport system permease subunit II
MHAINSSSAQGTTGKRRNPFLVWLVWPLITLGIYHLYWWYKINDEARRLDPSIKVDPVIALLALFPGGLIIVPAFVTIYRTGNRLRSMQRAAGMTPNVIPIVGLVLAFVFSLYALYYQVSLNGIWSNYGNQPENTPVAIQP